MSLGRTPHPRYHRFMKARLAILNDVVYFAALCSTSSIGVSYLPLFSHARHGMMLARTRRGEVGIECPSARSSHRQRFNATTISLLCSLAWFAMKIGTDRVADSERSWDQNESLRPLTRQIHLKREDDDSPGSRHCLIAVEIEVEGCRNADTRRYLDYGNT
ncbi:hypothetical protein EDD85DRAFT_789651 [Armillaria nabsnona]|nr:hypothetical protein EDD85DRAFT_789651 [Armillaria nabsnona]